MPQVTRGKKKHRPNINKREEMAKFKAEDKSEIKIRKTTEIIDNTNKFFENILKNIGKSLGIIRHKKRRDKITCKRGDIIT